MTTGTAGVGFGVGVGVGVAVGVGVGVGVGVPVGVGVGVPPPEHGLSGEPVLRGVGAPVAKSAELPSVSVQPPAARSTAFVLLGAGVAAAPSKQLAGVPKPTKATIWAPEGHATVCAVAVLTRATLPAVALMLIVPVASAAGSG